MQILKLGTALKASGKDGMVVVLVKDNCWLPGSECEVGALLRYRGAKKSTNIPCLQENSYRFGQT